MNTDAFERLLSATRSLSTAFLLACTTIALVSFILISNAHGLATQKSIQHLEERAESITNILKSEVRQSVTETGEAREAIALFEKAQIGPLATNVSVELICHQDPCDLQCNVYQAIPALDDHVQTWLDLGLPWEGASYQFDNICTAPPDTEGQSTEEVKEEIKKVIIDTRTCSTTRKGEALYGTIELTIETKTRSYKQTIECKVDNGVLEPVDDDTRAAVDMLKMLGKKDLEKSFAQLTTDITANIQTGVSISIAGMEIPLATVERFASYFILGFSIYLALHFWRLRQGVGSARVSSLAESTWFPLFPHGLCLATFVSLLLLGPVLAVRRDFVAALVDGYTLAAPPDDTFRVGVLAGLIAALSALRGLYPLFVLVQISEAESSDRVE